MSRTPSYKSGRIYVQESVALFPKESEAKKAFAALTNEKRTECIVSNTRFEGDSRILNARTGEREFGDGEHALLLDLEKKGKQIDAQVSTVRQGKAVGALLLVANPAPLSQRDAAKILKVAVERMSEAKSP